MRMSTLLEEVRKFSVDEAVSPAQQAAIAISKKERGEKPKKEEVQEDGHTDVASAQNNVKVAMSALTKMSGELSKLNPEDALPSWWTNKVAVAVDKIDGMADYLDTQVEEKDDFKPHMMYDPKTGKGHKADTMDDHLRMKKMGYTHDAPKKEEVKLGERLDPADVDDDATDDDIKSADKNIMMQLRKSVSLRGNFPVEFMDKKKIRVPAKVAQAVQSKYNSLRKPNDKEKFQSQVAKSYKDMLGAIKEAVSPAQQAAIAISKKERGEKPKKEAVISEKIEGLVNKAEKSGMPYSILKKVYDRGMAAYKTGHRPGTTAQQWAFARVNSFVTKSSGTWGKADKDLAKQVRGESVETESLWDNIRKKKARIAKGSGEKMRSKGDKGAPTPNQIKRASEDLNEWGEVTEKDDKSGKELNNPTRGDVKKYKVYVRNKKGNVVKVEFGDPNMSIKRDDPERRKAFRARHNCDQKKDKTTAGYWSCKFWSTKSVTDLMKG